MGSTDVECVRVHTSGVVTWLAGFNRRDWTNGLARLSRHWWRSIASVLPSGRSAGETPGRSASVVPASNPIERIACTKNRTDSWRFC